MTMNPACTTITKNSSKRWCRTHLSRNTATTTPGKTTRKPQVMGREVVVALTNGELDFGTWEQIFYGEFDGRRRKRVLVKIIGE